MTGKRSVLLSLSRLCGRVCTILLIAAGFHKWDIAANSDSLEEVPRITRSPQQILFGASFDPCRGLCPTEGATQAKRTCERSPLPRLTPRLYARYYNDIRTHRSLDKDAPISRQIQRFGSTNRTPSLADFTTTTPELKFSVHQAGVHQGTRRSGSRAAAWCTRATARADEIGIGILELQTPAWVYISTDRMGTQNRRD